MRWQGAPQGCRESQGSETPSLTTLTLQPLNARVVTCIAARLQCRGVSGSISNAVLRMRRCASGSDMFPDSLPSPPTRPHPRPRSRCWEKK